MYIEYNLLVRESKAHATHGDWRRGENRFQNSMQLSMFSMRGWQ